MLLTRTMWKLALAVLLLGATAYAQTTYASITGTVTDTTGAVVPNAKLVAVNVETGVKTAAQANEGGNFTLAQLKDGKYEVHAGVPGFKELVVRNIVLAPRDIRRVDIRLEVGNVQTSIEVSAGATLIETETARIADIRTTTQLNSLPLNTRGVFSFLVLSPGIAQQPDSSVMHFSGSHSNQQQFAIDGISFSDNSDGTFIGPLANYTESFQETRLDIANNTAEFGTLGQVTVVTKSGSNQLHGSAFDYYVTPMFRARDAFMQERNPGIRHQPGVSAGGPVVIPKLYDGRNRTFFFGSFETARGSSATQLLKPTVPLEAWRNGDFSGVDTTLTDPATGLPFPGNIIPASRINPVSQKIQDRFYPLPNVGDPNVYQTANYYEAKTRPYDPSTYWVARIDHHFSDRDIAYGRYTWHRLYNRPYESGLPTVGQRQQQRDNRAAVISWSHGFTPVLLNEFRWGFSIDDPKVEGPVNGPALVKELGLQGLAPGLPDKGGMLKIRWAQGLTSITQSDFGTPGFGQKNYQFQDTFSWFRGRHNLKFGGELRQGQWNDFRADQNLFGRLSFTGKFTGNEYADFILGIPRTAQRAFAPFNLGRRRWQYDFFALDDFRLSPKVTLNLGVRYEYHRPWRETNHLASMFDIASGKIVVEDGMLSKISPLFPKDYVGVVEASQAGLPAHSLMRPDRNNFAPRISIAYRPWSNNTVFRAGWGLFYDVVPFRPAFGSVPFKIAESAYTNPDNPDVIFPRVFPETGVAGPSQVSLPDAYDPNMKIPYSMQYNFTIEHQRWDMGFRVSYIGTTGRQGIWGYDYNSPVPDGRLYVDKPRPFPNFPGINYYTNGANHQYNGLNLEAQRRMVKGLYFQTALTWARDIYDMDYNGDLLNGEFLSENPFDRRRNFGPHRGIPTYRFTSNGLYQLPFGKGQKFLSNPSRIANVLAGGWELSAVYTLARGEFLTPVWNGDDPVGIINTDSASPGYAEGLRPDYLFNANLPSGQRGAGRWFDPSAFAAPQPGQFGTGGRGVIVGPGTNVLHLGLNKNFQLGERGPRLQWQITASNALNHPNWGAPNLNISDREGAGVITYTTSNNYNDNDLAASRTLRMSLRLTF